MLQQNDKYNTVNTAQISLDSSAKNGRDNSTGLSIMAKYEQPQGIKNVDDYWWDWLCVEA